jgi:ankyrin repeat protein
VDMLISYKADINAKTNAKNTPLHLAAIFGHDGAGALLSLSLISLSLSLSLSFSLSLTHSLSLSLYLYLSERSSW